MKFTIIISFVCVASILAGVLDAQRADDLHWRLYKSKFNRVYSNSTEEATRRAIFLNNKRMIEEHNQAKLSYKLGLNHLADWTDDELNRLKGIKVDLAELDEVRQAELPDFLRKMLEVSVDKLPESVDWRAYGRVGPVVWQGDCASDWAFATTGVLEGQEVKFNISQLVPLSAQNVMDCSPSGRDCDGGFMAKALRDLANNHGIESERNYPYLNPIYHSAHHTCAFDESKSVMSVKGAHMLPRSEEALQKVVAQFGPVAAALHSTNKFELYQEGVLDDTTCVPGYLNHAVLVVGYGRTQEYQDYWLVKNSYNQGWGEEGYARIARNKGHDCGLTAIATIPDL